MHEEREQTLNQLLVLMDGMEKHQRLVVIGATNRPDILDPALLRSGRFDRMLRLEPPKHAERVEILTIHTRQKPLDASVSLEEIAAQTEGLTGADLETLTNAAGLLALRRTRSDNGGPAPLVLTQEDFAAARTDMLRSNRQFDRLDAIMVESVSQFAEPTGPAIARVTLSNGDVVEGDVLWMNASHIKLRTADQGEVIIAKESAAQIAALAGTEAVPMADLAPDRWAERSLDVRS
jgi:cell division protease FtsH